MGITAKADYAGRAAASSAAVEADGVPVKGELLARSQGIPRTSSRTSSPSCVGRASSVPGAAPTAATSWRGPRPRSRWPTCCGRSRVRWPRCRGPGPEQLADDEAASHLAQVWVALRASLRSVLESVTLADLANGKLPAVVKERKKSKDAWKAH